MFKMTIELEGIQPNGEQLEEILEKSFESKDLETLKDSLEQEILTLCKEHGIHGIFFSTAIFEKDGEYIESDESYVFVYEDYEQVTSFETEMKDTDIEKAIALIKALDLEISEIENIEVCSYSNNMLKIGENKEYLVVNEKERANEVKEYIENSLWAFTPSFLAQETDQSLLAVYEAFMKAQLFENANEAILCLVEKFNGLDSFVESAVSADGYGQFLSPYDGTEIEKGDFFIYRHN